MILLAVIGIFDKFQSDSEEIDQKINFTKIRIVLITYLRSAGRLDVVVTESSSPPQPVSLTCRARVQASHDCKTGTRAA